MPFGSDIRYKLSGDTSSLERSFAKAEQVAERAGRQMSRSLSRGTRAQADKTGLSREQAAMLDKQYRADVERVNAERDLKRFQQDRLYQQANTLGKIAIVNKQLEKLEEAKKKHEIGSTRELQLQLAIEKKKAQLGDLKKQQIGETQAQGGQGFMAQIAGYIPRLIGGVIAAGLERAVSWQQSRIRVAQAQEESTGAGLAGLRGFLAEKGGAAGAVRQGRGTMKDLESQLEFEKQRREMLSTGIQGAVSAIAPEELAKSEETIAKLNAQIQIQHGRNQLLERDYETQNQQLQSELTTTRQITNAQSKGEANELRLAKIRTQAAKAIAWTARMFGTPEQKVQTQTALIAATGQENVARQNMRQQRLEIVRGFTQDAAQGRTFRNGAARPLSETERIAQRALRFRERARGAVLTGAQGEVPTALAAARKDEATVGKRLMRATSKVAAPDVSDLSALKQELVNSNSILKSIDSSLKTTDVGIGPITRK
jgi:hypothetical protein